MGIDYYLEDQERELERQRKPRFVQVGNKYIRVDGVIQINHTSTMVEIYYSGSDSAALFGEHAERFLSWWNANADVIHLDEDA